MSRISQVFCVSFSVALIFVLTGWTTQAYPQEKYPTRPINLVVAYNAGGGTDVTARIVATFLSKKWGVPVNVINKPGGKGIPGSYEVFQAAPNGYTMLAADSGVSEYLMVAEKNLPFDLMERTHVGAHSLQAYLLLVPAKSPFKTIKDVITECKNNPQKITYASLGGTTPMELTLKQFFAAIGADMSKTKPVLVNGGGEAVIMLAGGHVLLGSVSTGAVISSIRGGTIRALFVTSKVRNPLLPDLPTSAELGLPTVTAANWLGVSGPPKLPSHIIEKWETAFQEMVKDPDFISQLGKIGGVPFYLSGQEIKQFVLKNLEDLKKYWK